MFNVFFFISVKDVDGGIDQDIFDINEGLWFFFYIFYEVRRLNKFADMNFYLSSALGLDLFEGDIRLDGVS